MRWQRLFEDLEAQLEVLSRAERVAEEAEHTRAERGRVGLQDRFVTSVGEPLRVRVRGLGWLEVVLRDVGSDWILVDVATGGSGRARELLVPLAAVTGVEGLASRADQDESAASRRFGLRHALRGISRDRAVVRVHDIEGDHATGTVDRVLADHLDLARHADDGVRRTGQVRGHRAVPFGAIAAVRRV